MNKSIKNIIALTALFVIGFLALEGCNKKEARQPKVSGFFVSGCNDIVASRNEEAGNLRLLGLFLVASLQGEESDDEKCRQGDDVFD